MLLADYYSADKSTPMTNQELDHYWSIPTADLFRQFDNTSTEEERRQQLQE
jgi:hypothetical protein